MRAKRLGEIGKLLLVLFIVILCAEMRFTTVLQTQSYSSIRADEIDYWFYTYNLRTHGVYTRFRSAEDGPDTTRSPGFPLFAALFFTDANSFVPRTLLAQTALNACMIVPLLYVAYQLLGYWPALVTGFLYAISPHIIAVNFQFLTESLMTSTLIAILFVLYKAYQTRAVGWWILLGALVGWGALTRPYLGPFVLVLIPYLYFNCGANRARICAAVLIAFLGITTPWFVFSHLHRAEGQASLVVNQLHHGMYPNLMYKDQPRTYGYPYRFDPNTPVYEKGLHNLLPELWRRMREEPIRHLVWYLIGKPLTQWQWSLIQGRDPVFVYPVVISPYDFVPHFRLSYRLSKTLHYPLVVLALIGCIAVWIPALTKDLTPIQKDILRFAALLLAFATAIHMIAAPFPRYQIPQKPIMFLCAVATLTLALRKLKTFSPQKRSRQPRDPISDRSVIESACQAHDRPSSLAGLP